MEALCARFTDGLPKNLATGAIVADQGDLDSLIATTSRLQNTMGGVGGGTKERVL